LKKERPKRPTWIRIHSVRNIHLLPIFFVERERRKDLDDICVMEKKGGLEVRHGPSSSYQIFFLKKVAVPEKSEHSFRN
jgi:hypothetical protein